MKNLKKSIKINKIKEIDDSYSLCSLDNIFSVFNSINNILYLIYTKENKAIILYDIINNVKICEIKNAHNKVIANIRHHLDKQNKRDLIISISSEDNNIKLWNINNLECLLNLSNIYEEGFINSACFLEDYNNNIYIITSNFNFNSFQAIKVFDFKGNKIKEIKESNDKTYIIISYFDDITNKNYIVTGNMGFIKSFDFQENVMYNKYNDNSNKPHFSLIFYKEEKIMKLIDSCCDGKIRIWNFHSAELMNIIDFYVKINNISLLKNKYIFISCYDYTIRLLNLKDETVEEYEKIDQDIFSLYAIDHYTGRNFLITQGLDKDPIFIYNLEINV